MKFPFRNRVVQTSSNVEIGTGAGHHRSKVSAVKRRIASWEKWLDVVERRVAIGAGPRTMWTEPPVAFPGSFSRKLI